MSVTVKNGPTAISTLTYTLFRNKTTIRSSAQIAAVIDLVPRHGPDVRCLLVSRRLRLPMRHRERMNPFYPHRIVDVAEFVDVGGGRGEGPAEPAHGAAAPIASGEVFTNPPPSSA